MRIRFDEQLEYLKTQMIQMGALIEGAIAKAVKALISGDRELARMAVAADEEIDQKERRSKACV